MGDFNVEVHAAPLQLQLMMQEVLNRKIQTAQELEPIEGGALPTPGASPAGQDYKMQVSGGKAGRTFTHATLSGGSKALTSKEIGLFYWNGTTRIWSYRNGQELPNNRPQDFSSSTAYSVGAQIYFNGNEIFEVLTQTLVGENPSTIPGKFKSVLKGGNQNVDVALKSFASEGLVFDLDVPAQQSVIIDNLGNITPNSYSKMFGAINVQDYEKLEYDGTPYYGTQQQIGGLYSSIVGKKNDNTFVIVVPALITTVTALPPKSIFTVDLTDIKEIYVNVVNTAISRGFTLKGINGVPTEEDAVKKAIDRSFDDTYVKIIGDEVTTSLVFNRESALTTAQSSVPQYLFINSDYYVNREALLTKIFVKTETPIVGLPFYVCEFISGSSYKIISSFSINTVSGNNSIDVSNLGIRLNKNYTIGIFRASNTKLYFLDDADTSRSYSYFSGNPIIGSTVNFTRPNTAGGIAQYGFEAESSGAKISSTEFIQKTYDFLTSDDNEVSSNYIEVSRITIEGQSNAFGVGTTTELANSPFLTNSVDYNKSFDRVFIWNKYTEKYENLQIGVNNMASWDARYKNPAGATTPYPTIGVEIPIAMSWCENNKTGLLFIHKNIGDGRPISYFQKNDSSGVYLDFLSQKNKGDAYLKSKQYKVVDIGWFWIQGESNSGNSKEVYLSALNNLITSKKEDGLILNNTNIILAQIDSNNANYGLGVAQAKEQFVSDNKLSYLANYTNNYNTDRVHLNSVGIFNLGLEGIKNIIKSDFLKIDGLSFKNQWYK